MGRRRPAGGGSTKGFTSALAVAAAVCMVAGTATAEGADAQDSDWHFALSPYL
jgi:hypothetical protein